MGYFDDVPKKGDSTSMKSSGGYFSDIPLPEKKTSKVSGVASGIATVGKGFLEMFTKPSEEVLAAERKILPDESGRSALRKAISLPAKLATQGAVRLTAPGLIPIGKDIAEIYEINRKGGIADQVAAGKMPVEVLDDFEVLKKTAPQIVGDVAQAVLTAYSGGAGARTVTASNATKQSATQAIIQGGKQALPIGALFGGAMAASEQQGVVDALKTIGISTVTAGILGGIAAGTIPASKATVESVNSLLKQKPVRLAVQSAEKGVLPVPLNKERVLRPSVVGEAEGAVPVSTPKTKQAAYAKEMGYEPYTPESQLPVIPAGARPKETLPIIQADVPTPKPQLPEGMRYEPIKAPTPSVISSIIKEGKKSPIIVAEAKKQVVPKVETVVDSKPTPQVVPVKPKEVVGVGETKTRGLSRGVEEKAIENKLTNGFDDLPEYQTVNMKDQASRASKILADDEASAVRIAKGIDNAPDGTIPEAVFIAVEEKAIRDGNVDLLRELASSRLATESTTMGQRLRTLAERNPESPVRAVQDLTATRRKVIEQKMGKEKFAAERKSTRQAIEKELKKAEPKTNDWSSFVESIKC